MKYFSPFRPRILTLITALLLFAAASDAAETASASPPHGRVLFLGDSITYGGQYVDFVEAALRLTFPTNEFDFLNLGLPSETVSGLSEPGHANGDFPRPDLHERLERVLQKTRPALVVACYGMNDGIYYPFGEDRFAAFQKGMQRLHDRVVRTGAKIIHLTPPVFDPVPIKDRTLPAGLPEYKSPYGGYNEVLDRYSEWLLAQRDKGWEVVDVHGPINQFLEAKRKATPTFSLAGDGVHPGTLGHWLIARPLVSRFGVAPGIATAEDPGQVALTHRKWSSLLKIVQQRQAVLKDAWLSETRHLRPGMAKGKSLAEAQKTAADLESNLRILQAMEGNQARPPAR